MDVLEGRNLNKEKGSLFVSNFNGTVFTPSLQNTNRDQVGVDLQVVANAPSIIFSNVVSNPWQVDNGEVGKSLQTMITFHHGREWKRLRTDPSCSQDACFLNVHDAGSKIGASDFDKFVSTVIESGIMLASGNLGAALSQDPAKKGVFFSRNGGKNWKLIKQGDFHAVIGQFGSFIVLLDRLNPTDSMLVSIDDGENWKSIKFSGSAVAVKQIYFAEKTLKSTFVSFVVKNSFKDLELLTVDLASLFSSSCTDSDFEPWHLSSTSDSEAECILGEKITFMRRKSGKECLIAASLEEKRKAVQCECTRQDFEW